MKGLAILNLTKFSLNSAYVFLGWTVYAPYGTWHPCLTMCSRCMTNFDTAFSLHELVRLLRLVCGDAVVLLLPRNATSSIILATT
ncbi:hypothetical protein FOXYSP1_08690 [Fusarium oxysporum f. sp. phaseoli]